MNEPIVRRDDFWGDFVNGLFFRPVWRSVKLASQEADATTSYVDGEPEENRDSQDPHIGSETAPSILITEPIPGVNGRDIDLIVENGVLIIQAPAEVQTGDQGHLSFSRRIPLPPEADSGARVTSYHNGVLMVRIPLRRPANEPTATEAPGPTYIGKSLVELKARGRKAAFRPAGKDLDPNVGGAAPSFGTLEYDLFLNAFSEGATGTITRWLKQIGDRVEVDEPLLEVSTDKADIEIPSPMAGVIEEILVAEDEIVEVDAPLVRIRVGAGSAEAAAPPVAEAHRVKYEKTAPSSQARQGKEPVSQASERTGHRVPEQIRVLDRLVDEMYQRYEQDKNTVDAKWWPLFESFDAGDRPSTDSVFGEAPAAHPDSGDESNDASR